MYCKAILRQGKHTFAQKNFYLQGILSNINEQEIHLLFTENNGPTPDKFSLLPIEFHGFNSKMDFYRLSPFASWYSLKYGSL